MPKYCITNWRVEVRINALDISKLSKLDGSVWSTRLLLPVC